MSVLKTKTRMVKTRISGGTGLRENLTAPKNGRPDFTIQYPTRFRTLLHLLRRAVTEHYNNTLFQGFRHAHATLFSLSHNLCFRKSTSIIQEPSTCSPHFSHAILLYFWVISATVSTIWFHEAVVRKFVGHGLLDYQYLYSHRCLPFPLSFFLLYLPVTADVSF